MTETISSQLDEGLLNTNPFPVGATIKYQGMEWTLMNHDPEREVVTIGRGPFEQVEWEVPAERITFTV